MVHHNRLMPNTCISANVTWCTGTPHCSYRYQRTASGNIIMRPPRFHHVHSLFHFALEAHKKGRRLVNEKILRIVECVIYKKHGGQDRDCSRCNEVYWWVIGTYMHHAWLTHTLSTTRAETENWEPSPGKSIIWILTLISAREQMEV